MNKITIIEVNEKTVLDECTYSVKDDKMFNELLRSISKEKIYRDFDLNIFLKKIPIDTDYAYNNLGKYIGKNVMVSSFDTITKTLNTKGYIQELTLIIEEVDCSNNIIIVSVNENLVESKMKYIDDDSKKFNDLMCEIPKLRIYKNFDVNGYLKKYHIDDDSEKFILYQHNEQTVIVSTEVSTHKTLDGIFKTDLIINIREIEIYDKC